MPPTAPVHRRDFLRASAAGLALYPTLGGAVESAGGGLFAPRPTDFPAKAKHLVFVFLTGGFSHVDTFDYKPQLARDSGRVVPSVDLRGTGNQPLLGSPFRFTPRGDSGLMISELFPRLGDLADDLCVIRTLHTDIVEHFQAVLAMHTGSATVPMPSLGSWVSHGLGTFNSNLPSYVVLCEHLPYAGSQVWDSSFLPPIHQGVRLVPGDDPIPDLRPPSRPITIEQLESLMLNDVNARHAAQRPADVDLRARNATYDTARGMMRLAPEILDLGREPDSTRDAYGVARGDNRSFSAQCLLARRLVERGVRVVELIDTGAGDNWDAHGDMQAHRPKALRVDRALAALIRDLKQRGLFDQTLIAICTEFGRTPWTDAPGTKGRNHYAKAFSCVLAGAGIKGGTAYGATDEHGIKIIADPVHVHDYHATILHAMGLDHRKLTYRYAGRDFRLTDVDGRVITPILS
ncbi:MAG: DUF1501 domain-containing protein [Isosphaeraceae bacterium]|nr:DUF1501 domain-containing protein [Isosphaeraceae bacterium]